jgi:hypothetical protein
MYQNCFGSRGFVPEVCPIRGKCARGKLRLGLTTDPSTAHQTAENESSSVRACSISVQDLDRHGRGGN